MSNQITIPFTLEGQTANRETVRSVTKNADGLRKVPLSQIRIRPGFNARIQPSGVPDELWEKILGIPELADGIFISNGPADALIGDIYRIDECFYLTDGERRFRAIRYLITTGRDTYPNGTPVDEVLVILNPAGTTDLQRYKKIGTTQGKMELTTMQWAFYYLNMKDQFKLSNQQVADEMNVSRPKVDMYILATKLPQDVQDDIDAGKKNITTEVNAVRKKKADEDEEAHTKTPSEQAHDRKKEEESKMSGDEDEFEQQDNSVKGVSSMGGPKEDTSSGAITMGKDSIYKDQEDTAKWKQFINRFQVLLDECLKITEGDSEKAEPKLIERLKMEFIINRK